MTTLYHLHIPKTGGSYIENNLYQSGIKNILVNNDPIKIYTGTDNLNFDYIDPYHIKTSSFVHGHFGIGPMLIMPEIKPFTTIRNPLNRVISHFAMSYFPIKNSLIMDTFDSWVFDDSKDMMIKNNLQSMFLTNEMSKEFIDSNKDIKGSFEKEDMRTYWNSGFGINNIQPNIDKVRQILSKMIILEKTENMDIFMDKLYDYINKEFNCSLLYMKFPEPKIDRHSSGLSSFIRKNITKDQENKIKEMNELDFEIWNSID